MSWCCIWNSILCVRKRERERERERLYFIRCIYALWPKHFQPKVGLEIFTHQVLRLFSPHFINILGLINYWGLSYLEHTLLIICEWHHVYGSLSYFFSNLLAQLYKCPNNYVSWFTKGFYLFLKFEEIIKSDLMKILPLIYFKLISHI